MKCTKLSPLLLALCGVLILFGCQGAVRNETVTGNPLDPMRTAESHSQKKQSLTFFAMDTFMEMTVYTDDASLPGAARDKITELEQLASVTSPSSDIYRVNHRETDRVSHKTAALLKTALDLCAATDGALDISIYPVVRAWGFTTGEHRIPTEAELSALLENVDYSRIRLNGDGVSLPTGMEIDLGAVAKGYAGSQAAAYLRASGVTSALLSLGGNVQTVGAKPDGSPWRVAVQDPDGEGYAGVVEVVDKAAVTSGGYQRFFTGPDGTVYWHIMDPSTGKPARSGLRSVTIVAEDGAYCDALSTALFVMGPDRACDFWRERQDFGMVLITDDGRLLVTPDLSFTAMEPYTAEVLL